MPFGATVGAGRCLSPMHLTNKLRLTTKRIAWGAIFPQKRTIGFTLRAIRLSIPSRGKHPHRPAYAARSYERRYKCERNNFEQQHSLGLPSSGPVSVYCALDPLSHKGDAPQQYSLLTASFNCLPDIAGGSSSALR